MAIIKTVDQPQGTQYEYWRVAAFTLNRVQRFAEYHLYGYLTKADFDAGKAHGPTRRIHYDGTDFDNLLAAGNVTLGAREIVQQGEALFKAKADADPGDVHTGGVIDTDTEV